jgi:hypothetical protein
MKFSVVFLLLLLVLYTPLPSGAVKAIHYCINEKFREEPIYYWKSPNGFSVVPSLRCSSASTLFLQRDPNGEMSITRPVQRGRGCVKTQNKLPLGLVIGFFFFGWLIK